MNEKFKLRCRRTARYFLDNVFPPLLKIAPLVLSHFFPRWIGAEPKPPDQGHYSHLIEVGGHAETWDSAGRTQSFDFTLPDGTGVRLGFCSSLRYTRDFSGERKVVLNGQAEFFVVPDSGHPLMIQTARSTIQVLGTTVCVTDFANDSSCEVTLLEGKANVSHDDETLPLKMLQQAVIHDGRLSIRNTLYPEKCTGWADDDDRCLQFDQTDLYTAVQRVARWYRTKVIPLRDLSKVTVTGRIRLSLSLEENLAILKKLETGNARIKKRGLTIYIQ